MHVVEERAERGAGSSVAGVGHDLHRPLQIELRGYRVPPTLSSVSRVRASSACSTRFGSMFWPKLRYGPLRPGRRCAGFIGTPEQNSSPDSLLSAHRQQADEHADAEGDADGGHRAGLNRLAGDSRLLASPALGQLAARPCAMGGGRRSASRAPHRRPPRHSRPAPGRPGRLGRALRSRFARRLGWRRGRRFRWTSARWRRLRWLARRRLTAIWTSRHDEFSDGWASFT